MIKWKLPSIDEPGFLRRRRRMMELLDLPPTADSVDQMVEFLATFVDEPKKKAKELLLDANQKEYNLAIVALCGFKSSVSDPNAESSVPQ